MKLLIKLVFRNLTRRPGRTALTLIGVASAMFLFVGVESLSEGLKTAMSGTDAARTLIVYRQNRYCPQTSFLPERYAGSIRKISGVQTVLPVKVFLNNCRASLDLVTFQGAPVDELFAARNINVVAGDQGRFRRERDSALIGKAFADRRALSPGDKFVLGNITVNVAGIFSSGEPIEEGVVLTHLEFLQRSAPVARLGTVTQFEVKVEDASRIHEIAAEIDALFKTAEEPTDTRPRVQFLEDATRDLKELLHFGRIFGVVCVLVVLILVANTILMAVQERTSEFGVYLTLGYRGMHIFGLVVAETFMLTGLGAIAGISLALLTIRLTGITIGVEGVPVAFFASTRVLIGGFGVAALTGMLGGLLPAMRAARANIVQSLRST